MIDHMGITVRDLAKSKAFYSIALGALGYVTFTTDPDATGYGIREGHGKTTDPGGEFWLSEGAPMTPRIHVAFNAASPAHVDAFHAAGVARRRNRQRRARTSRPR